MVGQKSNAVVYMGSYMFHDSECPMVGTVVRPRLFVKLQLLEFLTIAFQLMSGLNFIHQAKSIEISLQAMIEHLFLS